jgi:allantoicase
MFNGFETKRSRGGHHEEVVVKLSTPTVGGGSSLCGPRVLLLDFSHFVNNNPHEIEVWGGGADDESGTWSHLLVPRTWVKPYAANLWYTLFDTSVCHISHIRVMVWPEGGINRIVLI